MRNRSTIRGGTVTHSIYILILIYALHSECVEMHRASDVVCCSTALSLPAAATANNEKKFPGKTEGGKGVGREREGLARTLPECYHLVWFVRLVLGPRCFETKKNSGSFPHLN